MFAKEYWIIYKNKFSNKVKANQILVANELGPADLFSESKNKFVGLVSELYGPEGHFAIASQDRYQFQQLWVQRVF